MMTTAQVKETPLSGEHRSLGARMVDFAGWSMPVQYSSIKEEHMAVRQAAGLFDVSHMGEFSISGADSAAFVQYMIANDIERLPPDHALYTQFVRPDGGVVDDLIVYRRAHDYLMVVNASNSDKDWAWLCQHKGPFLQVDMRDLSDQTALLALQGPESSRLMRDLVGSLAEELPSFGYGESDLAGVRIGFGRTGYTGEDGFEIFVPAEQSEKIWKIILEQGQVGGIRPCGLGARDTLRLEAALPLYGHELDESTSPLEAGLGWSVKLEKGDFLGRDALVRQKESGVSKKLVCLKVDSKALPRQGYAILSGDTTVGAVTSGSQGIFVGYPVAMGYVTPEVAGIGNHLLVDIRGKAVEAQVVKRPFYRTLS